MICIFFYYVVLRPVGSNPLCYLASVKVVPLSSTFTVSPEGSVECSSE